MSEDLKQRLADIMNHPSYRLAYLDEDFIRSEDLRPLRLELELLKTEMILDRNAAVKDDFKRRLELAMEAEKLFDQDPDVRARITEPRHPAENGVRQRTI